MFIKLDSEVRGLLCCSFCSGEIKDIGNRYLCNDCGTEYPVASVSVGSHEESFYDFRLQRPPYCDPTGVAKWKAVQGEYVKFSREVRTTDDLSAYLAEIDCVREIYNHEFKMGGRILDVGGNQGKLRHFLSESMVSMYVSVDPYLESFEHIEDRPSLLKAYPCLGEPCNFMACHAENLPFRRRTFDWVHMRSVLDHFRDPYQALKEAYKALKNDGTLLIGLTVRGGPSPLQARGAESITAGISLGRIRDTFQRGGVGGIVSAAMYRLGRRRVQTDDHMFYWQYEDLLDLLNVCGFTLVSERWQKPPLDMCLYLTAKKKERAAK
jgi:SAM-dependent methyltransferase